MNPTIRNAERPNWNAHNHEVLGLLGVKRLPVDGMSPREIQGITVWVEPLRVEKPIRGKRHDRRIRAICPACGREFSVGRLHQHAKIHR